MIDNVSQEVLKLYLDLIYGKEIELKDWRTVFDLYDFLEYTSTNWNKDVVVCVDDILPEEYSEYIGRLNNVYSEGLSKSLIEYTAQFIKGTPDLSEFGEEFIQIVLTSAYYKNSPTNTSQIIAQLMKKGLGKNLLASFIH